MDKIKKALLVLIAAVIFLIVASAVTISVNFVFDMLPIEASVIALVIICIVVGYIFVSDWFDKPKAIESEEQEEAVEIVETATEDELPVVIDYKYWHNFYENWHSLEGKEFEDWLRDTINNDILKGMSLGRALRYKNTDILNAVESMVEYIIRDEVLKCPFVDEFVEVKDRALGDVTPWYACKDTAESVSSFAGNHYDVRCRRFDFNSETVFPREWIYCDVYANKTLEHFLLGVYSFDNFKNIVCKKVNKFIQERIYLNFQNIVAPVNPELCYFGNDKNSLNDLCNEIKKHNGCDKLIIAGTRGALRKLSKFMPDESKDSEDEKKDSCGVMGEWNGNKLMVITQTARNDFEFDMNNKLFILCCDNCWYKPIKIDFIGDIRTSMSLDCVGYEPEVVQVAMATGLLTSKDYGIYTFSD